MFFPITHFDTVALELLFRALVLQRLHAAERLSSGFRDRLLSWSPSGLSVEASHFVAANDSHRLERLIRYIVRSPLALDKVRLLDDDRAAIETPRWVM